MLTTVPTTITRIVNEVPAGEPHFRDNDFSARSIERLTQAGYLTAKRAVNLDGRNIRIVQPDDHLQGGDAFIIGHAKLHSSSYNFFVFLCFYQDHLNQTKQIKPALSACSTNPSILLLRAGHGRIRRPPHLEDSRHCLQATLAGPECRPA